MGIRGTRGETGLAIGTAALTVALVASAVAASGPDAPAAVTPAAAPVTAPAAAAAPRQPHVRPHHVRPHDRQHDRQHSVEAAPRRAAAPEASAVPATTERRSVSAIDPDLQRRLVKKMSRSTAGVYGFAVDVAGVGTVAAVKAHRALRPASSQKLFTTLPLLLDSPDRRLVTTIASREKPRRGVVRGNLVVTASADPSLTVRDVNRLAKRVRAAGVRRVTGQLRLDIGTLPTRTRQDGWKRSFVPDEIGPLSPFPVGRDWWRMDRSYRRHPTAHNLSLLRERLARHGVRIRGGNAVVRDSDAGHRLAVHRARPIRGLVHRTLTWSDNFFAESLLAVAGGHRAVRRVTRAAGITDRSEATDGSGLSYDDRQTAAGEVALLRYAWDSSARKPLLDALPVGCRTGTLEDRFCRTPGAGEVFAKTGTLSHSRVLAGYTRTADGRLVTFAVICAKVRDLTAAAEATDRAVLLLRDYAPSNR